MTRQQVIELRLQCYIINQNIDRSIHQSIVFLLFSIITGRYKHYFFDLPIKLLDKRSVDDKMMKGCLPITSSISADV